VLHHLMLASKGAKKSSAGEIIPVTLVKSLSDKFPVGLSGNCL
jgi:hypothetical protein